MNWIDITILIILGISLISGLFNGFVKEVSSFVALILGIWGAIKFSSFTAMKLYEWFDMTGEFVGLVSFIVTFIVIVVAIHFVGIAIDKLISAISLGLLNKILGALFSVFKSVLIMSIIFVILNIINEHRQILPSEKIEESALYNSIADIAPAIFPIIGEGQLKNSFDRLRGDDILI